MEAERLTAELDKHAKTISTAHGNLVQTAIQAPVPGTAFQVINGVQAVKGSKLGLATGLSKVVTVTASIDNGATASNFTVTARITPADTTKIDLFVWQPTAAGNTTPVACTATVNIHWWAVGQALVAAG